MSMRSLGFEFLDLIITTRSKERENQRISMRIDLEVLNSIGHIMTISIMQSGDDGVRYERHGRGTRE